MPCTSPAADGDAHPPLLDAILQAARGRASLHINHQPGDHPAGHPHRELALQLHHHGAQVVLTAGFWCGGYERSAGVQSGEGPPCVSAILPASVAAGLMLSLPVLGGPPLACLRALQTKQQGLTVCNGPEYPDHAFPALNQKQVKVSSLSLQVGMRQRIEEENMSRGMANRWSCGKFRRQLSSC